MDEEKDGGNFYSSPKSKVRCSPKTGRWLLTDISVHTCLLWVSMAPFPISQASKAWTLESVTLCYMFLKRQLCKAWLSQASGASQREFTQSRLSWSIHAFARAPKTTHPPTREMAVKKETFCLSVFPEILWPTQTTPHQNLFLINLAFHAKC